MITERSISLLSSVTLISTNRIKVLRLWLTSFEGWPIRILTFAWWMLKTRNTMFSWQAFPSLPPRVPLAFPSRLKLSFPSLSYACHAGYYMSSNMHFSIPHKWFPRLKYDSFQTKFHWPTSKRKSSLVAFNYLALYGNMQWHDLNESNWCCSLHHSWKLPTLARWCFLRSDLWLFVFLSHGRSASLRALLQIWFRGGGLPYKRLMGMDRCLGSHYQ